MTEESTKKDTKIMGDKANKVGKKLSLADKTIDIAQKTGLPIKLATKSGISSALD
jgi:hypothetical protein